MAQEQQLGLCSDTSCFCHLGPM